MANGPLRKGGGGRSGEERCSGFLKCAKSIRGFFFFFSEKDEQRRQTGRRRGSSSAGWLTSRQRSSVPASTRKLQLMVV